LGNATTRRGAQDDDAKHDPSPGNLDVPEVDTSTCTIPIGNVSRLEVHLRQNVKLSLPLAYLRAAHAYMLISMPTGTSTIFGVFQAIWLSFVIGRTPP
jgi:hypothetical protein